MGGNKEVSAKADEDPTIVTRKRLTSAEMLQFLKISTDMYRRENQTMETMIIKSRSLTQIRNECYDILEQLIQLQPQFDTKELNTEAVTLSYSQKVRQFDNYSAKIKICIKMYLALNEKLTNDIKTMQSTLEESKSELDRTIDISKIKLIDAKIQRYENDLINLETKYPWLKKNGELDIINIAKEMETLNSLRDKKAKLIEELHVYGGLKPDIAEATRQIEQIKLEHDDLNRKIMENV